MRISLASLAFFAVAGLSLPAFADEATPAAPPAPAADATGGAAGAAGGAKQNGIEVGARLGYGLPMGDAAKDSKLSEGINGQIPIWIDAGYRINPNIYAGLFFSYGFVSLKSDKCPDGADCSASDMRFGVGAQYHIMPEAAFDPWLGLGVGYEIANSKVSAGGAESSVSFSGLEFLNLQVGGDYKVMPGLALGPFASFSLGQYSSSKVKSPLGEKSDDIAEKAMHEWLTFGVRGTFTL